MFSAVLIANRGEIALRAIRTFKRLGIRSVAVYSDSDRNSAHVRAADTAIALVGDKPADTYLRIDKLIAACRQSGAEAVFPGYGFLSENAEFAAACEASEIVFLGPTPKQIRDFGLKHCARELAAKAGVPTTPGSGLLDSMEELLGAAGSPRLPPDGQDHCGRRRHRTVVLRVARRTSSTPMKASRV